MGLVLVWLQGTNRDEACFATFDHSDIRGFDRMTYFRHGAASVYRRKFGMALFHSRSEGSPERSRVSVSTLDVLLTFSLAS